MNKIGIKQKIAQSIVFLVSGGRDWRIAYNFLIWGRNVGLILAKNHSLTPNSQLRQLKIEIYNSLNYQEILYFKRLSRFFRVKISMLWVLGMKLSYIHKKKSCQNLDSPLKQKITLENFQGMLEERMDPNVGIPMLQMFISLYVFLTFKSLFK